MMIEFLNEHGGALHLMYADLKKLDKESYTAWVAQSEKEFPSRDEAGNYIPRSFYEHEPTEELEAVRERHLKIHGALCSFRRFCLDCGLRIKD